MAGRVVLVRYGAVPEVGRFACALDTPVERGGRVVVHSHRGPELGTVLQVLGPVSGPSPQQGGDTEPPFEVARHATADDLARHDDLRAEAQAAFSGWQKRIDEWNLTLELIDLEWTLDRQKLVLYVLGGRGPDTTRLALQAVTEGSTVIEVQPVSAEGVVPLPSGGGGCGSGGCGCNH